MSLHNTVQISCLCFRWRSCEIHKKKKWGQGFSRLLPLSDISGKKRKPSSQFWRKASAVSVVIDQSAPGPTCDDRWGQLGNLLRDHRSNSRQKWIIQVKSHSHFSVTDSRCILTDAFPRLYEMKHLEGKNSTTRYERLIISQKPAFCRDGALLMNRNRFLVYW